VTITNSLVTNGTSVGVRFITSHNATITNNSLQSIDL
ncbi:hypothetical protein LCGC14_2317210, partial [marine sediment metagenome]